MFDCFRRDYAVNILQVISSISTVKTCAVTSYISDHHDKSWRDNYTTLLLFAVLNSQDNHNVLLHELHSKMHQLLPSYCIPDSVILMDTLPMTSHGNIHIMLYYRLHYGYM